MKTKGYILLTILLSISISVFCQTSQEYLNMANKAYTGGDTTKAKELYLKAAKMGNAEAHYALAYRYVLSPEESIYHLSEAAKLGNSDAMAQLFDELVFRANSLTYANPELAYKIYQVGKSKNPSLSFFDDDAEIKTIKEIIEAGPFDVNAFVKKFEIKDSELDDYGIWELAAEASRGGRFGAPNLKLTLQLIGRGGNVPAEVIYAVNAVYSAWVKNEEFEFKVCDYVTSGMGLSYCSAKEEEKANEEYFVRIKKLSLKLKNNAGSMLLNAFKTASEFIESKAWHEELNGGSGYAAWTRESIMTQKQQYLNMIEQINKGVNADTIIAATNYDKILNETYKIVMDRLKNKPITDFNAEVNTVGVLDTQRLWLKYRDNSAKLFSTIAPSINIDEWKNWLTKIRVKELENILVLKKM